MFEELKEILLMVAQAGEFTLQAALSLVIAFGIYKLLTLASILVLVKFTIDKVHNYFITKKVIPEVSVKYEIRNCRLFVSDEAKMYKIALLSHDLFYLSRGLPVEIKNDTDTFGWQSMDKCIEVLQKETQRCLNQKEQA